MISMILCPRFNLVVSSSGLTVRNKKEERDRSVFDLISWRSCVGVYHFFFSSLDPISGCYLWCCYSFTHRRKKKREKWETTMKHGIYMYVRKKRSSQFKYLLFGSERQEAVNQTIIFSSPTTGCFYKIWGVGPKYSSSSDVMERMSEIWFIPDFPLFFMSLCSGWRYCHN